MSYASSPGFFSRVESISDTSRSQLQSIRPLHFAQSAQSLQQTLAQRPMTPHSFDESTSVAHSHSTPSADQRGPGPIFDAPSTRGRGGRGGRGSRGRSRAQATREGDGSFLQPEPAPTSRNKRRPQGDCQGGWGEHPEMPNGTHCPYEITRRNPTFGIPEFQNLTTEQLSADEYSFELFAAAVQLSINSIEHLGYHVDYTLLLEQDPNDLELIIKEIYESLTHTCRTMDPGHMLFELYEMWCQSFKFLSTQSEVDASSQLPKDANEVIVRSLACIDSFAMMYTVLAKHYKLERVFATPEKQDVLRQCQEIITRMHLVCRGFACLSQATQLGLGQASVERVAHEYSLKLPFLVGMELPIDFNIPGRNALGVYSPLTEPYQYFMRWILQLIQTRKYRIHGEMLYTQHTITDPSNPSQVVFTRYWKPLMEVSKFVYHVVQPVGQESVFRSVISTRQSGMNQIVEQITKSNFVQGINPDFRYRSFRNGLYQMDIDPSQEPTLPQDDPARMNGRFLPYSSPRCPVNVASETFFDCDFDPAWLECSVMDLSTPCLDTLLSTQNISPSMRVRHVAAAASDRPIDARGVPDDSVTSSDRLEGMRRMQLVKSILGDGISIDDTDLEWEYDMSFVYTMALFLCGRCLRPLSYKVKTHTGEQDMQTDNYQCAPFFVGNPGTGKSTLLTILSKMYHQTSTFELKCNSDSQFGLGQLADENIKFGYMTETSRTMPWSVSVLNSLVEGGMTEFRGFHKKPVTKKATFTWAFAANPDQVPMDWIKDPRQGFRRRLAVFEFMVSPEKSDSEFLNRLLRQEELARMLVKFNRMYLCGRFFFDSLRLARGSFNFMTYLIQHMYFSRVRSNLFALASPADSFVSIENDSMVYLDSTSNKCYLIQDIMRAVRDFCAQRQVPQQRVPTQQTMIVSLQQNGCTLLEGNVAEEELEHVVKGIETKDKRGNPVKLTFVQGIVLKGGAYYGFSPINVSRTKSAGTSLSYETSAERRGTKRSQRSEESVSQVIQDLIAGISEHEFASNE